MSDIIESVSSESHSLVDSINKSFRKGTTKPPVIKNLNNSHDQRTAKDRSIKINLEKVDKYEGSSSERSLNSATSNFKNVNVMTKDGVNKSPEKLKEKKQSSINVNLHKQVSPNKKGSKARLKEKSDKE